MICEYLKNWSAQKVFDVVATHLLSQKEKCQVFYDSPSGVLSKCVYRNNKNNKILNCAAGCLIPDSEYYEDLEEKSWGTLVAREMATPEHCGLISRLQYVHDEHSPSDWTSSLLSVARENNLDFREDFYVE